MIDFHTHPVMIKELIEADPALDQKIHDVFGFFFPPQPLECFLLEMDEAGVDKAVLLPIDCSTAHHCRIVTNEQVADLSNKNPRLIGFASVDPSRPTAAAELEYAVKSLGLRGLKLDPSLQRFDLANKDSLYPLYETCANLRIPVVIHCGMSWTPSGLAGLSQPLLLEEAIQAFPALNFVMAHCGWPWIQEATMLAVKYPNAYLDTAILYSGTPQDTMKHVLGQQIGLEVIERSLFNKLVLGTNYPRVDMRRFVRGLKALGLSPATEKAIFSDNAGRLLNQEMLQ
jgi:predicted TIM-barrel fold metal-dependent hydrolase